MPYRRLPNTNTARIKALQMAVKKENNSAFTERCLENSTFMQAQILEARLRALLDQFDTSFSSRVTTNKKYMYNLQKTRMYVSHFIQVLNMSVIRGDIKRAVKSLYHLDTDNDVVPNLASERDILLWGKNIIEGEDERTRSGGVPFIYPSISKVKVFYDVFKQQYFEQQQLKKNTDRIYKELDELRVAVDEVIVKIWNEVEEHFKEMPIYDRVEKCKEYGLIYYYRKGEEQLRTPVKQ